MPDSCQFNNCELKLMSISIINISVIGWGKVRIELFINSTLKNDKDIAKLFNRQVSDNNDFLINQISKSIHTLIF